MYSHTNVGLLFCVDSGFNVPGVCGRSFARTAGSNSAGAWMSVLVNFASCQVEISAKGPITLPEESYRVLCV